MICKVKYVSYKEVEIPEEVMAKQSEEEVIQHIFNTFPDCLTVEEVIDADGYSIIENY